MSLGAPELATKEYWDARYETDDKDGYDWFKNWSELSDFFRKHLTIESRILILGCGTSSLSEELYNAGYKHITSMDFSPIAINLMKERHAGRTEMKWDVMDIRDLAYPDESFDVAIDKKGTMDAMLCYKGSPWDPPEDVVENCRKEMNETARILVSGGKFLMISFRPAHFLRPRVRNDAWTTEPLIEQIGNFYFSVTAEKK